MKSELTLPKDQVIEIVTQYIQTIKRYHNKVKSPEIKACYKKQLQELDNALNTITEKP